MYNDKHQQLIERLKALASNYRQDQPGKWQGTAIIEFTVYIQRGELKGWTRPSRIPLEPLPFDLTMFELETVTAGWNGVYIDLKRQKATGARALVIREDGTPAGWFVGEKMLEVA